MLGVYSDNSFSRFSQNSQITPKIFASPSQILAKLSTEYNNKKIVLPSMKLIRENVAKVRNGH